MKQKYTKYTQINKQINLRTVKWAQCDKTQSRELSKCDYAQLQYT